MKHLWEEDQQKARSRLKKTQKEKNLPKKSIIKQIAQKEVNLKTTEREEPPKKVNNKTNSPKRKKKTG